MTKEINNDDKQKLIAKHTGKNPDIEVKGKFTEALAAKRKEDWDNTKGKAKVLGKIKNNGSGEDKSQLKEPKQQQAKQVSKETQNKFQNKIKNNPPTPSKGKNKEISKQSPKPPVKGK